MAEYDDKSWHTPMFVEQVLVKVEAARQNAELDQDTKPSSEMEDYIFKTAHTREEYMSLIARLIMYLREHSKSASSFDNVQIPEDRRQEVADRVEEVTRRGSMDVQD